MPLVEDFDEIRGGRTTRVGGIYAMSSEEIKGSGRVKIGISTHIRKRLNSYGTCHVDGVLVWALLQLREDVDIGNTIEEKKALLAVLGRHEEELFAKLDRYRVRTAHRPRSEVFDAPIAVVKRAFTALAKKHPTVFMPAVTRFNSKPAAVIDTFIEDGVVMSAKPIAGSGVPQPGTKTRSGRAVKAPAKMRDMVYLDTREPCASCAGSAPAKPAKPAKPPKPKAAPKKKPAARAPRKKPDD